MFRKMKISILLTSILTSLFLLQVVSGVLFLNYAKDQKTHTVLLDYETKKVAALDGAWIALIRSRFEINRAQKYIDYTNRKDLGYSKLALAERHLEKSKINFNDYKLMNSMLKNKNEIELIDSFDNYYNA